MLKVILAGGGSLGHAAPLLAIHDALPEADFLYIGTRNGIERSLVFKKNIQYRSIISSKWRRYISFRNIIDIVKFPFAFAQSLYYIITFWPDVVITSGGFVAVPIGFASWILGRTLVLHQQDLYPGLANRILQRFAQKITVAFEEQKKMFSEKKVVLTGNPARVDSGAVRGKDDNVVLILGGSQGARTLNTALISVMPDILKEASVVHVLGNNNFDQRFSDETERYRPIKFLDDDYFKILNSARVVVTRAGMATLTELAYFKKAAILISLPHSHQEYNTNFFVTKQAAVSAPQEKPEEILSSILHLLQDGSECIRLASNLASLFLPDAGIRYARLIHSLAPTRTQKKTVYFVGIGGIGISSIARYFLENGWNVMGSDISQNEATSKLKALGAKIFATHDKNNVPKDVMLLLYSSAVPKNNEEIREVTRRHGTVYSYNEYLGLLSKQYETIAITGTHGKTTTTAMMGIVGIEAKLDPTIVVGSFIPQLGNSNFRSGRGKLLIVEADEYRAHMLLLQPAAVILTNIDADHLDFYRDIDDVTNRFEQFLDMLPREGVAVIGYDDTRTRNLKTTGHKITFGFSSDADFSATMLRSENGIQYFEVTKKGMLFGDFSISIPGKFNVLNALAVIALADHYAIPVEAVKKALASYKGSWRRFELTGMFKNCPVYSDYAHHPTAIESTIQGVRNFFPEKRIVLVFQPHSFERTQSLFSEFAESLSLCDVLILAEIYDVPGRDHVKNVSSEKLLEAVKLQNKYYASDEKDAASLVSRYVREGDIVLVMGAGTIDSVARSIVQ